MSHTPSIMNMRCSLAYVRDVRDVRDVRAPRDKSQSYSLNTAIHQYNY